MLKKKKYIWVYITILIILEQGIKLVINRSYLEANMPILKPWLYFRPMFNRDYSWFNSMFQLGIGKYLHISVVTVMIILIYLFFRFLNNQSNTTQLIDTTFIFIFSGAICSLIDKVLWNGSLDYILIKPLFTFDLKDVYIDVSIALLLFMLIINHKGIRDANEKDIAKGFIKFVFKR